MSGVPFDVPDEAAARTLLVDVLDRLTETAAAAVAEWTRSCVGAIAAAYGRLDGATTQRLDDACETAADDAAAYVRTGLTALRSVDPAAPGVPGPLEVVRAAYRFPTAALRDAGVPPVERDEFETRHFPDDDYGLRIQSFAELPDGDDLAVLHTIWGSAKAAVLRERRGSAP